MSASKSMLINERHPMQSPLLLTKGKTLKSEKDKKLPKDSNESNGFQTPINRTWSQLIAQDQSYRSKPYPQDDVDVDEENRESLVTRIWNQLKLNEWTFTLFLFIFSLTIIFAKLLVSHGYLNFFDIKSHLLYVPASNGSSSYYQAITDKAIIIEPINKYSWLIKAALSGLATTAITWFIIYEDSNVPGINPPSPFSPSIKKSLQTETTSSQIQINYIVGILNGFLVFLYMCLCP